MIHRLVVISSLLVLWSCGGTKTISSPSFTLVVFGETGGVIGAGTQYGLSGNGMVMRTSSGNGEPEMLGSLKPEDMKHIYYLVQEAKKVDEFRMETANLNRKIIIQSDAENKSYYWKMPDDGVPEPVLKLYNRLSQIPDQISE